MVEGYRGQDLQGCREIPEIVKSDPLECEFFYIRQGCTLHKGWRIDSKALRKRPLEKGGSPAIYFGHTRPWDFQVLAYSGGA